LSDIVASVVQEKADRRPPDTLNDAGRQRAYGVPIAAGVIRDENAEEAVPDPYAVTPMAQKVPEAS